MKVLKWHTSVQCKYCGSILLVDETDLKWADFGDDYTPIPSRRIYVTCVVCGYDHTIEVPDYLRDLTRDKWVK